MFLSSSEDVTAARVVQRRLRSRMRRGAGKTVAAAPSGRAAFDRGAVCSSIATKETREIPRFARSTAGLGMPPQKWRMAEIQIAPLPRVLEVCSFMLAAFILFVCSDAIFWNEEQQL